MPSDLPDILRSLAAIQLELRKLIPVAVPGGGTRAPSSPRDEILTGYLGQCPVLGCRLLHWNPELADFRVYQPLDVRIGGKPHVFFAKLYKTKYCQPGPPRSDSATAERQFGVTYSDSRPKREVTPTLDAFKQCATEAGELVASAKEGLGPVLPAETLAAKNDLHRWIFTVYDVAWQAPPGSPRAATRYIPMIGLDGFMSTDESVIYDLDYLRSTPWSEVERRFDKNGRGNFSHFAGPYASWSTELPQYYASRIDDIVQASDWTIDWLVKELQRGP